MDINTESWHYKVVRSWNNDKDWKMPTSLCKYVQQLLTALFLGIIVVMFVSAVLFLLAGMVWSFLSVTVWNVLNGLPPHLLFTDMIFKNTVVQGDPTLMAVAFLVNTGLVLWGIGYVIYTIGKWVFELFSFIMTKLEAPPGEEGSFRELFWHYSHSIKEGICPTINYVDEDESNAN